MLASWTKPEILEDINNEILAAVKAGRNFITFECPECKNVLRIPLPGEEIQEDELMKLFQTYASQRMN